MLCRSYLLNKNESRIVVTKTNFAILATNYKQLYCTVYVSNSLHRLTRDIYTITEAHRDAFYSLRKKINNNSERATLIARIILIHDLYIDNFECNFFQLIKIKNYLIIF